MRQLLITLWLFLFSAFFAHAEDRPVWLELVLAMDVSTSVDAREYRLQQQGLGLAFADRDVMAAIGATGGVAISVVQWAGRNSARKVLDWRILETEADSQAMALAMQALPRGARGFTDIAGAIDFSSRLFQANGYRGARQVIDVSGDGTATEVNPADARDRALAQGITVNALVILNEDMDLGIMADEDTISHYETFVVGGPQAFLIVADGFEDFARAIKEKLLREIGAPHLAGLEPVRQSPQRVKILDF